MPPSLHHVYLAALRESYYNILLDWFLVGVVKMGVAGAAIATDISQLVGGVFPVLYFAGKNSSCLRLVPARIHFADLGKSLANGKIL